jgi:hypothetical protein
LFIGWFFLATRRTPGVFRLAFSCLEDRENTTMTVVWEELTLGFLKWEAAAASADKAIGSNFARRGDWFSAGESG